MEGFTAGTLVHAQGGLKPIEAIASGELVLSQPQSTGERSYKRVLRVRQEERAIARLRYWTQRDGGSVSQELLATPSHPVYVAEYHNNGSFSDEYWQEMDKPIGWRRADSLESHQLVAAANGESMHSSRVELIWRTRAPGIGWLENNRDSEMGHCVTVSDGRATGERRPWVLADLTGVDDFNFRNATPQAQEKWGYKCAVFSLDVEEFGTYYVGEQGIWVRSS